jgi:hypothetical protein
MTTPLFDHAELRRIADALEGLLALARAHVTPAPAPAPADFDSAQYADAFDAKMGDPMQALGNLTPFAAPAADPNDDDIDADLDYLFGATPTRARYTYTHWSKYDTRCRELARLRTAANHRAAAAKTPAVRDAATLEAQQHHNEAKARHSRLRRWLAEGKVDFVNGELVVYDGARSFTWRSEYLQAPNYILTLPNS